MFLLTLWGRSAAAQVAASSFDLERLNPDLGATSSQVLSTGDGLRGGTLRLSLLLQWEKDPLVFYRDGARVGALIGDRLTPQLGVAWAPLDWLEFGLGVPFVAYQTGDALSGQGVPTVSSGGMGSPLVQGRLTFLRQELGAPLDLGLTLGLTLPLGNAAAFTKDPGSGFGFYPRLGLGRSFGLIRLGAELGAGVRAAGRLYPFGTAVADETGSTVHVGVTATTTNQGLRGELTARATAPLTRTAAAVDLLAGARWGLAHGFELYALLGPGLGQLPGVPAFRVLGGVAWTPIAPAACVEGQPYALGECPRLDRDGDGVANSDDACPEQHGLASLGGCADRDDDGDGVPNQADACPKVAGPRSQGGCPTPDADGDGVDDALDACPSAMGPAATKGCPDADGDGVADADDACPEVAGPNGGCADVDTDGDGVVDRLDQCPNEPGSDEKGCGPAPLAARTAERIQLASEIRFELGKATLVDASTPVLDAVAALLLKHPDVRRVRIEGHTDDLGPKEFNLKLSQDRADAVKAALVQRGVEAARLEAKGFGPDRPVQPNTSRQARELNRRVELRLANQD